MFKLRGLKNISIFFYRNGFLFPTKQWIIKKFT